MAEETAVAFTYNGTTHAVMMATPADLEDFALGFSLSEAVIDTPAEVVSLEVIRSNQGIELRMWIACAMNCYGGARRRRLAGPVGCGLCGIESLAEAVRPAPVVTSDPTCRPATSHRRWRAASTTVAEPRGASGSRCRLLAPGAR